MGYPQFNLVTLQLIAPSSNMTLQEYKDAYGIDLTATDIHAFKIVLFGGEKYAIDQIKDIEGGHEVYFNGRVLTITDTIETSDAVYDVANAKPVYCHPIAIVGTASSDRLACLIFDNNPTPFTKNSFIAYLDSLYSAVEDQVRIATTGAFVNDEKLCIASYLGMDGSSSYYVLGVETISSSSTKRNFTKAQLEAFISDVYDGVNKIN